MKDLKDFYLGPYLATTVVYVDLYQMDYQRKDTCNQTYMTVFLRLMLQSIL